MKIFYLLFIFSSQAFAWEFGAGFQKRNEVAQDKSGDKVSHPFDLAFAVGNTFNLTPEYVFSPYIGYIRHEVKGDDGYAGDYTLTTITLIYDFIWSPGMSVNGGYAIRYGLGNFIRKTDGKGGSVTVPNGSSGTDTAYRPGGESVSYSTSFNIGAEYFMGPLTQSMLASGIRGELFLFHPLNEEKRTYTLNFMWMGYF